MDTTNKTIADTIINGLKKTVVELEEFRVQAALGKAEARDAFETAKKNFREFMHETEQRFSAPQAAATEMATKLKVAIEELRVQLALGKAESRDAFEEQYRKIDHALQKVDSFLTNHQFAADYRESVNHEIQKFKIKLEILKLRYELNKVVAHEEFETRKKEFSDKLESLGKTLREKEKQAEKTWEHFKHDVAEVYGEMKKTFVG